MVLKHRGNFVSGRLGYFQTVVEHSRAYFIYHSSVPFAPWLSPAHIHRPPIQPLLWERKASNSATRPYLCPGADREVQEAQDEGLWLGSLKGRGCSVFCKGPPHGPFCSLPCPVFLSFFGIASIGLSCLVALFLYHVVFGIQYLGILNGVAAFVIVGIGELSSSHGRELPLENSVPSSPSPPRRRSK